MTACPHHRLTGVRGTSTPNSRGWPTRWRCEGCGSIIGTCANCGYALIHPSDTNCRNCFASDTDET